MWKANVFCPDHITGKLKWLRYIYGNSAGELFSKVRILLNIAPHLKVYHAHKMRGNNGKSK